MIRSPYRLVVVLIAAMAAVATVHAEPLQLDADTAAAMAIEASNLSTAAAERVAASGSAVRAADAARLPSISANASYVNRSAVPEFGVPTDDPEEPVFILFPNIENTYSLDVTLTQPIYTGGRIAAGRDGARFDEASAGQSQRLTALDLAYTARRLYWAAVAAEAGLEVADAQLRRAERLLADAIALREAGMALNADVYAAEARTAAAQVDVIRAQTERDQAQARLLSLLGVVGDVPVELADRDTSAVPAPPVGLEDLVAGAIERRPEIGVADARIESLGAQARATRAERRPTVGLSAHWKVAQPNERYLPPVDERNDSWAVGVSASWKLFDGSRTSEQVAAVRGEQRAVRADRGELERQIRLDVTTARLELIAALEAVSASDASAEAATAWEAASGERYAAGLALIYELLDAQADLAAAEMAQVQTRATAWMAEATLARAVGR
jgi:outer membrane protein TolC